jgi:hypothetical protein
MKTGESHHAKNEEHEAMIQQDETDDPYDGKHVHAA